MNNYDKLSVIGRGAHGVCILCRHKGDKFGQQVVIKQIPIDNIGIVSAQNATLGEVRTLQMLHHPNIIGYYESFIGDSALCIVMQYAEGGTLSQMLEERIGAHLDTNAIMWFFAQIISSLNYLHTKQILHRDLKTQNILLNRARTICKLSDFGISKHLGSKSVASTVIGTLSYLSPEICEGRVYNQKSDLWALGCVLYEMAMLQRAFEAPSLPALVMKITQGRYEPIGAHVNQHLRTLIESLLELNEHRRPDIADIIINPIVLPTLARVSIDLGTIAVQPSTAKTIDIHKDQMQQQQLRLKTRPSGVGGY